MSHPSRTSRWLIGFLGVGVVALAMAAPHWGVTRRQLSNAGGKAAGRLGSSLDASKRATGGESSNQRATPIAALRADKVNKAGIEQDADARGEGFGDPDVPRGSSGPRFDEPQGFATYRHMQMADEFGDIPTDGLMRAKQQADAMRAAPAAVTDVAGISRAAWTWLGPGNIGGRVRAIAVHPTTTSTIFAGAVGGGIWKSVNSGASWSPVNDFMANLAVSCIVFQPGAPATMYAGTGEGFYNFDRIQGAGIFKSTDGGTTWSQLSATANSNFNFVNRIAISADGLTILAGTSVGIYRSLDAGTTWTKVLTPSSPQRIDILDVKFLPGSSTNAVASGYSTNAYFSSDGGSSWTLATGIGPSGTFIRVEIGVAPSAPATVYLSVDVSHGQVWQSSDSGHSYSFVSQPAHLGGQGWYDNTIWVDPTDATRVVVGGTILAGSTDGGVTWTTRGYGAGIHSDNHTIVSDPGYNGTTNKRVYVGNDGGVYTTADVTTSPFTSVAFTSLNNNLGITQFYGAGGNASSGKIIGGTQDNGTLLYTTAGGPQGWTSPFGGDGGYSAADTADPNYFYGEYVDLEIHRSANGGVSSSYIYGTDNLGNCKAAPYSITDACNGTALFIAPFILDPNNQNTLLAGGLSLWRTTDAKTALTSTTGPTWAAIKPSVGSSSYISAMAVAPGDSNTVWVGYNNGLLYRTTNGTAAAPTWTQVSTIASRMVTRIAIDPNNSNTVYVTFGGFNAGNIYKSVNGGTTFSVSAGSGGTALPTAPIYSVVVHPTNSNFVYVGTEVGVFASPDGGATWGLPQDGPANVSVDELFWMGTTLLAATHGRGIFKAAVAAPSNGAMSLDAPGSGASLSQPFAVAGWAIDLGSASGTGVDAVHVWAFPGSGSPIFVGVATYGGARGDVGAAFGSQFTNSGFGLTVTGLPLGTYTLVTYAHSTVTGTFNQSRAASITVTLPPSMPAMSLDAPGSPTTVSVPFYSAGWAIDQGAPSGTGVDAVHVWAFVLNGNGSLGSATFLGVASYGGARSDVGAAYGGRFTNSGFFLPIASLATGTYRLAVYAHSTVTGTFNQVRTADVTVVPSTVMSIDSPPGGSTHSQPFVVAGWAIDRAAPTGPGVDAINIWAYPVSGSGGPFFAGAGGYGGVRGDVGAAFGSQFTNSGYNTYVSGLASGTYDLVVYAHSTVSGAFNQWRTVRIIIP